MPAFDKGVYLSGKKKHIAHVIQHKEANPGHHVINWECDSCDFIEVVGWTERDYEKMTTAECSIQDKWWESLPDEFRNIRG